MITTRNNPCALVLAFLFFVVIAALILLAGCMPPLPTQAPTSPVESPTPTNTEYPTVTPTKAATAVPTGTPCPVCVVATGYDRGTVNVRSGPGMNYPVVDVAYEGEALVITGPTNSGWAKTNKGFFYAERWCEK